MRPCPACGIHGCRTLVVGIPLGRPEGVPGDQEIRVYTCDACGMGFSDDGVTQRALDEYYAEMGKYGDLGMYAGGDDGGLGTEAPWELARARSLADFIAANAPADSRVMDLGCSTGTLLVLLRERGFNNVCGIEPLSSAVRIARESRGLDVSEGWITTLQGEGVYDVVVLSHVLEHVIGIHEALDLVHRALTADGLLVVEVPDAHRFHQYVHIPNQDFNTEHINHFSPTILSALVESARYECVALQEALAGAGPDHAYPVMRGAWRRAEHGHPIDVCDRDRESHRDALVSYTDISEEMFVDIDARTRELVRTDDFGIWGAGQFTMKWLGRDAFPDDQLTLVVDSAASRRGLRLRGHDVIAPGSVPRDEWPPVMLAGSAYAAAAITDAAARMGITSRVASPFES
jgi:SAM-dependent methyltransferase